jgi:hypothetical protein
MRIRDLLILSALTLSITTVPVRAVSGKAQPEESDSEETESGAPAGGAAESGATSVADMLGADATAAPPPAMLKRLEPIARLISKELALDPALAPADVMSWGPADVNGDHSPELVISWGRGKVSGGLALVTRDRVMAIADFKRPVLKVQLIKLAGDRSRHFLVRSGADQQAGSSERFTQVLALKGKTFVSLWQHRDVDNIAGNPDTSGPREAQLSDVTFEDGLGGRPGTISLTVRTFAAAPGVGEEGTVEKGQQLRRFTYDRDSGKLIEREVTAAERARAKAADAEVDAILRGSQPKPSPKADEDEE